MNFRIIRGVTTMELIEVITSTENLNRAYKKVVANKGYRSKTMEEPQNHLPKPSLPQPIRTYLKIK